MSKKKIKTNINRKEENMIVEENQIKSFLIILVTMLILFSLFYFLTVWIKYEKKKYVPIEHTSEINYDKILLGNLFDYKGEYYVLAVDGDYEEYFNLIESEIGVTVGNILKKQCYTVSLEDRMNSKFVSKTSNLNISNINDLKVSTTTLFHIKDKKIIYAYEGSDAIFDYLHKNVKK